MTATSHEFSRVYTFSYRRSGCENVLMILRHYKGSGRLAWVARVSTEEKFLKNVSFFVCCLSLPVLTDEWCADGDDKTRWLLFGDVMICAVRAYLRTFRSCLLVWRRQEDFLPVPYSRLM